MGSGSKKAWLPCIDVDSWLAKAKNSSDEQVCSAAVSLSGSVKIWRSDQKPDEAIFQIWFEEAKARGLLCGVDENSSEKVREKAESILKSDTDVLEFARQYQHDGLPYAGDKNVKIYGGYSIPENPEKVGNTNTETLKYYYYRYLNYPRFGGSYSSGPSDSPAVLNKKLRKEPFVTEQMQKTALVSYLLYEDGRITVDEISPEDRLGEFFTIKNPLIKGTEGPKLVGHSVGKSMVSYVLGHAICEGYIKGVDSVIDDWPLIEGTLYHGQKITDLINMRAGDNNYAG